MRDQEVCESEAFGSHPVEAGGTDLFGAVTTKVAVAEVVPENQNYIWGAARSPRAKIRPRM